MKKQETTRSLYRGIASQVWKFSFILGFALMIAAAASAQGGVEEDPDAVPIDGGISLLVAAGVGYGVKKAHEAKKKKAAAESEKL